MFACPITGVREPVLADPRADAIGWPGPSARSIRQPVDLGSFEDAEPCRVPFRRRHALLAGTTGAGKSGGLNVLMATLAWCDDVVIWTIDLKQGMELQPWAGCSTDWRGPLSDGHPHLLPRPAPRRAATCAAGTRVPDSAQQPVEGTQRGCRSGRSRHSSAQATA